MKKFFSKIPGRYFPHREEPIKAVPLVACICTGECRMIHHHYKGNPDGDVDIYNGYCMRCGKTVEEDDNYNYLHTPRAAAVAWNREMERRRDEWKQRPMFKTDNHSDNHQR